MKMRPAQKGDAGAIRALIHRVGINPMDLNWRHFLVMVDEQENLIACGQIKRHGDGSREMASLAVMDEFRGRGYARQIVERLLAENPPPLYLTCRSSIKELYEKFGFRELQYKEMPPYFRWLSKIARVLIWLSGRKESLSVMIRG